MEPPVSSSLYGVGILAAIAAEHGVKVDRLLAGTDVTAQSLQDPRAAIHPRQELAVISRLLQHLDHVPGLGLDVGKRYHMAVFGLAALAVGSSSTVRDAVAVGLRYLPQALGLTEMYSEENGQGCRVVVTAGHLPPKLQQFVMERNFAVGCTLLREIFPSAVLPQCSMMLQFPAPPYVERFRAVQGVMPEFGADWNGFIVPAPLLDLPMPYANPYMSTLCGYRLRALAVRSSQRQSISRRVREILLRYAGVPPDMTTVARELNTTARHLRRLLAAEGVSFRVLLDEKRKALAEELMSNARLSVQQIAERLAFREVASFSKAFKRWKGIPPSRWRGQ